MPANKRAGREREEGGGKEGRRAKTNDRVLVEEVEDFSLEDVRPWGENDSRESNLEGEEEEAD